MTDRPILLVDDEVGIRKVLEISLRDSGFDVFQADNGRDALDLFRQALPPIVLTDIKMPGMDGIELLRRIKQERPDTEVIMITGHGDMELAIRSLAYEATYFITKPINDEDLEAAIERAQSRIQRREAERTRIRELERSLAEVTGAVTDGARLEAAHPAFQELDRISRRLRICLLAVTTLAERGTSKEVERIRDMLKDIADRLARVL